MTRAPVCIVGATASGKTALAVALAEALGDAELVSVDAMAVYRGLDIGTAKPDARERAAGVWHGLDLVEPGEEFSVARFRDEIVGSLATIAARDRRAILVGGSGLYHRAVIDGLEIPPRFPERAAALERRAEAEGLVGLYAELERRDPLAASRIEPTNRRRLVRALEVIEGSGAAFSSFGPGLEQYGATRYLIIGLRRDRALLALRIHERLVAQLAAGFLDEVRGLAARPGGLSRTARQALGYRELLEHLSGALSLEAALARIEQRTRTFARRQEAWFARDPRVVWVDAAAPGLLDRTLELVAAADRTAATSMRE